MIPTPKSQRAKQYAKTLQVHADLSKGWRKPKYINAREKLIAKAGVLIDKKKEEMK